MRGNWELMSGPRFSEAIQGHTGQENVLVDLATDASGSHYDFYTCSTDGSLYQWTSATFQSKDGTPVEKKIGEQAHSCVSWHGENVFFGYTSVDELTEIESNTLGRLSAVSGDILPPVLQFSLSLTTTSASKKYVAAGSLDFCVKWKNFSENSKVQRVECDNLPVCVAIDPLEKFIAASFCDGSVCIYDLLSGNKCAELEKLFPGFTDCHPKNSRAILVWNKTGSELYVPAYGKIKVIERSSFTELPSTFQHEETNTETFSTAALSPCGNYFAAATLRGKVCIWKTRIRSPVSYSQYENKSRKIPISAIGFDPSQFGNLIIVDTKECVSILHDAVSMEHLDAIEQSVSSSVKAAEQSDEDDEEPVKPKKRNVNSFFDDEAESDGEVTNDDEATNKEVVETELRDEDEDTRMSTDIAAIKKRFGFADEQMGIDDDLDNRPDTFVPITDFEVPPTTSQVTAVSFKPPLLPPQFVSGGVPEKTHDGVRLRKRFLKWNSSGVIRWFKEDDDESTIEIQFHDVSVYSEIVLPNKDTRYCMGDLCDQAIVLASKERGQRPRVFDDEMKGQILRSLQDRQWGSRLGGIDDVHVIHITAWDNESRTWTVQLPLGDGAVDVMVTKELVAVLTKQRNLRIFTLTGTQRHVISHAEPILTACAFGRQVAVVSVHGGPYWVENEEDGNREPRFEHTVTIYTLPANNSYARRTECVRVIPLPLGLNNQIMWTNFTNKGRLVVMDSSCVVRLLTHQNFWAPIFSSSEDEVRARSDTLWPISVVESAQRPQIRYIYCRGSRHPLVELKQTPVIAEWKLPLCNPESDKTKLESSLLLNEMLRAADGEASKEDLSNLVKLFAIAVKSERNARASELASFCTTSKGIQIMCNYAAKQKRNTLVEKVSEIGREAVANVENRSFSSSSGNSSEHGAFAPRRVVMKRRQGEEIEDRRTSQVRDLSDGQEMRDDHLSNEPSIDVVPEEEEVPDTPTPRCSTNVLPLQNSQKKNPFKRSLNVSTMSDTSMSLFEQLESPLNPRGKRQDAEETQKVFTPRVKQAKLNFGGAAREKENMDAIPKTAEGKHTAFDLWLFENESRLRSDFTGDEMDFSKFCAQSFRMLPPTQKKEWKSRAETA